MALFNIKYVLHADHFFFSGFMHIFSGASKIKIKKPCFWYFFEPHIKYTYKLKKKIIIKEKISLRECHFISES